MSSQFGFHTTGQEVLDVSASSIVGKTIVLTGPTPTSLGAKVFELLASHPTSKPARIILLGRSLEKTQPLIEKLKALSPTTTTTFVPLDLTSFPSIHAAAASIIVLPNLRIDILLLNAGVMALEKFTPTPEGIESQFGINHIRHFLLTNLLLTSTLSIFAPSARIISLSSEGHVFSPVQLPPSTSMITKATALAAVNFGSQSEHYDEWKAYGQSKTANVLFTHSLATKLTNRDIQAFSLHPGMIFETALGTHLGGTNWDEVLSVFDDNGRGRPGIKTLGEGLSTIVFTVLDAGLAVHSGAYLRDCKVVEPMPWASSAENADKLWEVSETIVGQKFAY